MRTYSAACAWRLRPEQNRGGRSIRFLARARAHARLKLLSSVADSVALGRLLDKGKPDEAGAAGLRVGAHRSEPITLYGVKTLDLTIAERGQFPTHQGRVWGCGTRPVIESLSLTRGRALLIGTQQQTPGHTERRAAPRIRIKTLRGVSATVRPSVNRSLHCTQLRSIPSSPQTPLPLPVPHPAWPAHRTFLKALPDPSPETVLPRARANRRWQSSMLPRDRSRRSVPSRIDASFRSHRGDKRGRAGGCQWGRSSGEILYGTRSDRLSTA